MNPDLLIPTPSRKPTKKQRRRSIIRLYETECWPFTAWAQDYLQGGGSEVSRLGMSVHKAIRLELLDRDATIAKQNAEIAALRARVADLEKEPNEPSIFGENFDNLIERVIVECVGAWQAGYGC